jgi:hypothetical protein
MQSAMIMQRFSGPALSVRCCRLSGFVCSLLILWTTVDSQFLLLVAPECISPASPNASPVQQDDDDMITQVDSKPSLRSWRRNCSPPLMIATDLGLTVQECCSDISFYHRNRLTVPVCENEHRNGIGAPLLC